MSIELSDEDLERLLTAIQHYDAYLQSQKREDNAYRDLADRLQRVNKKPAASVTKPAARVKSR